MVIVNNLSVRIQGSTILTNLSCTLQPGRITTFIGPSGAGKTTLLKAIAGLAPSTQGEVMINDTPVTTLSPQERAQKIGYVFQDFNLFTNLNALDNCIDPLLVQGIPYEQARQKALSTLTQLGMESYLDSYPAQLSGGQQQRVAIARSLCLNPEVLLLDEPSASLDPANTQILAKILHDLAARGLTIGVSSQDMAFVRLVFDRVYFVRSGEMVELCDGQAQLKDCPQIARFMGTND